MVSRAQKFRLGIFLVVISVLMIIFLVLIAGNKIMEKRDTYYIRYQDLTVSGLQVGGPVRYHGIGIGRVDEINIDSEDVTSVIVVVSVKENTPLKQDVSAALTPIGITGLLQIEISGGSNAAKLLSPGSFIESGGSAFQSISGKAEVIADKVEVLLNNLAAITNEENRLKLENILSNVDSLIDDNRQPVTAMIQNLDLMISELGNTTEYLKSTIAKLDSIMQSGKLENIISNTDIITSDIAKADIKQTITDLNEMIKQVDTAVTHIDATHLESRQDILDMVETLKETIDYLNDFSRQISEDPSLLIRTRKK
jgi:phospholipid/cholesterol/gamma-HCH transport system substrate-binding protein